MSDTMTLEMRVSAHDEASPILRKIRREVTELGKSIGKAFGSPASQKFMSGFDSLKDRAQAFRTEIERSNQAVVAGISQRAAAEKRARSQASRDTAQAQRSEAAFQSYSLKALREKLAFGSRMTRQRIQEAAAVERAEASAQAEAIRSLRTRMTVSSSLMRQRLAEERATAREQARSERERVSANPPDIATLSISTSTRTAYSKARVAYFDKEKNLRTFVEALAPNGANAQYPSYTVGRVANSKGEAEALAQSQINYLTRGMCEGQITLSRGDPFVRDQSRLLITNARDGIGGSYVADKVVHVFTTAGGLGTSMTIRSDGDASDFAAEATESELTSPPALPGMPRSPSTGTAQALP